MNQMIFESVILAGGILLSGITAKLPVSGALEKIPRGRFVREIEELGLSVYERGGSGEPFTITLENQNAVTSFLLKDSGNFTIGELDPEHILFSEMGPHGTGIHIWIPHILDRKTLQEQEYILEDPLIFLDSVMRQKTEGAIITVTFDEWDTVYKMPVYNDRNTAYDRVYYEDAVEYRTQDGKMFCDIMLFQGWKFRGTIELPYVYQDGRFLIDRENMMFYREDPDTIPVHMLRGRTALADSDLYINTGFGIYTFYSDTKETELLLEQDNIWTLAYLGNYLFFLDCDLQGQGMPVMKNLYGYDLNTGKCSVVMELPDGVYDMKASEDHLYIFRMENGVGSYETYEFLQDSGLKKAENAPDLELIANYFATEEYVFNITDGGAGFTLSCGKNALMTRREENHEYCLLSCSKDYVAVLDVDYSDDGSTAKVYVCSLEENTSYIEICDFWPSYAEIQGGWVVVYGVKDDGTEDYIIYDLNKREVQNLFLR